MKVKIEKVLKAHEPFSGVSKTSGKPYKIWAYECKGAIDGTASDLFTVKAMSEAQANLLQAGGEFDAEASVYKNETTYMVKGAFAGAPGGGWKGKSNYMPRVYLSGKQFADMMEWCWAMALRFATPPTITTAMQQTPDRVIAAQLFDKIAGCASVMLDLSKYAQPKPTTQPIRSATAADVQMATGADPHEGLVDELPNSGTIESADVPF